MNFWDFIRPAPGGESAAVSPEKEDPREEEQQEDLKARKIRIHLFVSLDFPVIELFGPENQEEIHDHPHALVAILTTRHKQLVKTMKHPWNVLQNCWNI